MKRALRENAIDVGIAALAVIAVLVMARLGGSW